MSTSDLIRWGGLAALVSGALIIIGQILDFVLIGGQPFSVAATTSGWVISLIPFLVSSGLALLGLTGLYAHQAEEAGAFGFIAFLIAFAGQSLDFGWTWGFGFLLPTVAEAAPDIVDTDPTGLLAVGLFLTFIVFAIGWLLFGLSSLLTNVLPRWGVVLLIIGVVLGFVLDALEAPFSFVVFGIALAWLGWALWSEESKAMPAPSM